MRLLRHQHRLFAATVRASAAEALLIALGGCQRGAPGCADERVLAEVKRLLVHKHVAITNERIRGRRKTDVLRLGREWLESATFPTTLTEEYDEGAKRVFRPA